MRISDWSSDVCSSDLTENNSRSHPRPRRSTSTAALPPKAAASRGGRRRRKGFENIPRAIEDGCSPRNWFWRKTSEPDEIGRASCWEGVRKYVEIWGVAVYVKKKN